MRIALKRRMRAPSCRTIYSAADALAIGAATWLKPRAIQLVKDLPVGETQRAQIFAGTALKPLAA
jgi:hypothetical protein